MTASGLRSFMCFVLSISCLWGCSTFNKPVDRAFFNEYQQHGNHYFSDRGHDLMDVISCSFEYPVLGAAIIAGPLKFGVLNRVHTGGAASGPGFGGMAPLNGCGYRCGQLGCYEQDESVLGMAMDSLPAYPDTSRAVLRGKGRKAGEDAYNTAPMLFRIGAAAGVFGGVRLEFNFGELVDFIVGFAGVDLMDDDLNNMIHGVSYLDLKNSELDVLSGKIGHFTDLRRLDISGNRLTELPPELKKLRKLSELNAGHNRLTSFPEALCGHDYLAVLRLKGNAIQSLPPNFKHLRALEILDLSDNGLTGIPLALCQTRRLIDLDLKENRIDRLPPEIGHLSYLENMDLAGNPLGQIPPVLLSLHRLKTLSLSRTGLTQVPGDMTGLSSLSRLDLSFNGIEHLDASIPGNMPKLEILDLRGNPLSKDDMVDLYCLFGNHVRLDVPFEECMAGPAHEKNGRPSGHGKKRLKNALGMDFVYAEPGWFFMGSPESERRRFSDEERHQVTLTRGYFMQTTEVTVDQWNAVMGNSGPSVVKPGCGDCPVTDVSWHDAMAFIRTLNEREGHNTYRLPTEAEWEYACRAGSQTPFPFDKNLPSSRAGYTGHAVKTGRLSPNFWGIYDMSGNVEEWCADWYGEYSGGHSVDPEGPETGEGRVIRSSGFDGKHVRSAQRNLNRPDFKSSTLGFRLARNL